MHLFSFADPNIINRFPIDLLVVFTHVTKSFELYVELYKVVNELMVEELFGYY